MKENIYFKILKIFTNNNKLKLLIQNTTNKDLDLKINELSYMFKKDEVLFTDYLENNEVNIIVNNITYKYNFLKERKISLGFGSNSLVETKTKSVQIDTVNIGDMILDSEGKEIYVKNVIVFKINKSYKPLIIDKSNCGINLPYSPLIMSIKNNLKIKKVILKGRSLFLNGKAKVYNFSEDENLYAIETEGKKDFLLNGFIVESV